MRSRIVAGNWKMNLLQAEAIALVRAVREGLAEERTRVIVFPSYPLIPAVAAELR